MKRQKAKALEEKIQAGKTLSLILLASGVLFACVSLWIISFIIFAVLLLIMGVSFVIALLPIDQGGGYKNLNPIKRTFFNAGYIIEMIGYLSSIG